MLLILLLKKLIKLDLKTITVEKHVKLIAWKKVPQNTALEQKQIIDIFQDLPLKNMNNLELMEQKLSSNVFYQNEMINALNILILQSL